MADVLTPLTLDFLDWIAAEPREYASVMDRWRTSCPRLTVWEDAIDAGFVAHSNAGGRHLVILTPAGQAFLAPRRT